MLAYARGLLQTESEGVYFANNCDLEYFVDLHAKILWSKYKYNEAICEGSSISFHFMCKSLNTVPPRINPPLE